MSASIVSVDGQPVVFGLDWVPLAGDTSEKKEVQSLVADLDAAFEVRYANEHAIMFGFLADSDVPDRLSTAAKSKLLSASVLLATFPQITSNAIWIEVDGQTARMAVLKDGLPLPSGDFSGEIADAEDRIRQIEADSGVSFTYYGNFASVYGSSIPITLDELVREGSAAAATLKRASKSVNLKQIALLLLLVGIGAYLVLPDMIKPRKPPAAKQEDPNVTYQRTIGSKLAAEGTPVSAAMPALLGDWNIEILQGGWVLSKVACQVSACIYTWEALGGNFQSLVAALGRKQYVFPLDGKTASYEVPNPPVKETHIDHRSLPPFDDFKFREGTLKQDLALVATTLSFDEPSVFGAAPGLNLAALREVVRSGAVHGAGPAALLQDTLSRLPDSIVIERVEIATNGVNPTFSFEGKYYVKN